MRESGVELRNGNAKRGGRISTVAKSAGKALFGGIVLAIAAGPLPASAALPFLTDDAGTLGKGTSQIEWWYARFADKKTVDGSSVKTDTNHLGATFGRGVAGNVDLTLGLARPWGKVDVGGSSSNDAGSADFTLNAKGQLYERSGVAFTVKPQIGYTYSVGGTGDDHTVSCGGWLIVTREHEALAVHLNAGYVHNDYGSAADRGARKSGIFSLSALATYEVLKGLKLGLDVGASTNPDKASGEMPVYALAGAVYSPSRNVDLSLGFQFGVTKPAPDVAGNAGVTVRF